MVAGWFPMERDGWRRRIGGLLFVALLHLAMIALFLTLAPAAMQQQVADAISFRTVEPPAPPAPPAPEIAEEAIEATLAPPELAIAEPIPETPPAPVAIPLPPPPDSTALAPPPPAPAPAAPPGRKRVYGPPDLRPPPAPDSVRVEGTGPNGEPLYAAAWYREPYPDELRGYLSTATGPGWGLIACRTVADYRVEDCVVLAESPVGSGIARAVREAAWQFRVRPPRIGGRDQVGEWVRIRIDYERRGTGR